MKNTIMEKMKDIYIKSKQINKKVLNVIKTRTNKYNVEQIFFQEKEKEINKKYNKKNISIMKYFIENEKNQKEIKIFGENFVKNNRKKCKIIINNKEKELMEIMEINEKIKLEIHDSLINIKEMFYKCQSIKSIDRMNTNNVKNMSCLFYGCSSLSSLPDISKWNICKVIHIGCLFFGYYSLTSLPDFSKWRINNVETINFLFYGFSSLQSLADISIHATLLI